MNQTNGIRLRLTIDGYRRKMQLRIDGHHDVLHSTMKILWRYCCGPFGEYRSTSSPMAMDACTNLHAHLTCEARREVSTERSYRSVTSQIIIGEHNTTFTIVVGGRQGEVNVKIAGEDGVIFYF